MGVFENSTLLYGLIQNMGKIGGNLFLIALYVVCCWGAANAAPSASTEVLSDDEAPHAIIYDLTNGWGEVTWGSYIHHKHRHGQKPLDEKLGVETVQECMEMCEANDKCKAINFWLANGPKERKCTLNDTTGNEGDGVSFVAKAPRDQNVLYKLRNHA